MLRFHRSVAIIWLIFTVLFFGLAFFHWRLSTHAAPDLIVTSRPLAGSNTPGITTSVIIQGMPIDQPLSDFAKHFNEYVHAQNNDSRFANLLSMAGYIFAALVSLVSFAIEMAEIKKKNENIPTSGQPDA